MKTQLPKDYIARGKTGAATLSITTFRITTTNLTIYRQNA
jgi:hypothetical protein